MYMSRSNSLLTLLKVIISSVGLSGLAILLLFSLANPQPIKDPKLPQSVLTSVPELKPEHHKELNLPNVASDRFEELRGEYANNPKAQQQIDVYDPTTEWHDKWAEYIQAAKEDNEEKMVELEEWFNEHYPDI